MGPVPEAVRRSSRPFPMRITVLFAYQIDVRACFYACTVTMDEGLRNLLSERQENEPWLSFQAWFHGALLNPDDFNQA